MKDNDNSPFSLLALLSLVFVLAMLTINLPFITAAHL
jgi:hypothetical protein